MPTVLIQATAGTFPEGFCPSGPGALQQLYNEIIARTQFSLAADKAFYNFGDTAPTPENRVFPWLRTIGGNPERWYVHVGGSWLSPYRVPANSSEGMIWFGTEAALWSHDGGDGVNPSTTAPTITTGSFWQRKTVLDGRLLMAIGAIPGSDPANSIGVGETQGAGSHKQQADEVADHTHKISSKASITSGNNVEVVSSGSGSEDGLQIGASGNLESPLAVGSPVYTTVQKATSLIPPVYGVIFAERTIRAYWTA